VVRDLHLQVAPIFFYFKASKFCGFANALGWVLYLAKVVNGFNLNGLKYNTICYQGILFSFIEKTSIN
jgi:hypothetical protein